MYPMLRVLSLFLQAGFLTPQDYDYTDYPEISTYSFTRTGIPVGVPDEAKGLDVGTLKEALKACINQTACHSVVQCLEPNALYLVNGGTAITDDSSINICFSFEKSEEQCFGGTTAPPSTLSLRPITRYRITGKRWYFIWKKDVSATYPDIFYCQRITWNYLTNATQCPDVIPFYVAPDGFSLALQKTLKNSFVGYVSPTSNSACGATLPIIAYSQTVGTGAASTTYNFYLAEGTTRNPGKRLGIVFYAWYGVGGTCIDTKMDTNCARYKKMYPGQNSFARTSTIANTQFAAGNIAYPNLTLAMRNCLTSGADCTHIRCCTVTSPSSCVVGTIGRVAVLEGENEQCIYYVKQAGVCTDSSVAVVQLSASDVVATSSVTSTSIKPITTTTKKTTTTAAPSTTLRRIPIFYRTGGSPNVYVWTNTIGGITPTNMYCTGKSWWYSATDPKCTGSLKLWVNANGGQLSARAARPNSNWHQLGWVATAGACGADQTVLQYQSAAANGGFNYLRSGTGKPDGYLKGKIAFATWSGSADCVDAAVWNACDRVAALAKSPLC